MQLVSTPIRSVWINNMQPLKVLTAVPKRNKPVKKKTVKKKPVVTQLNNAQVKILACIKEHGPITCSGLRTQLNTSPSTIARAINLLMDMRLIYAETIKKYTHYKVPTS